MNKFILFSRLHHSSPVVSKSISWNIRKVYTSTHYVYLKLIALPHLAQDTQDVDISVSYKLIHSYPYRYKTASSSYTRAAVDDHWPR